MNKETKRKENWADAAAFAANGATAFAVFPLLVWWARGPVWVMGASLAMAAACLAAAFVAGAAPYCTRADWLELAAAIVQYMASGFCLLGALAFYGSGAAMLGAVFATLFVAVFVQAGCTLYNFIQG